MNTPHPIQLTELERTELTTSCVSMLGVLRKDKYANPETILFWENLLLKLIRAKRLQTKGDSDGSEG